MTSAIILASSLLAVVLVVALVREVRLRRAPIIAAAITQVGLWLVCLAPLALCGYLLYVLRHAGDDDAAVTELLIDEIIAEHPRLLPLETQRAEQRALPDAGKAILADAAGVEQKQVGGEASSR